MQQIDPDGALRLAAAIARQWIREQPDELPAVAAWLGIETDELRRRRRSPSSRRSLNGRRLTHALRRPDHPQEGKP